MLHNNYTQQDYKPYHIILEADLHKHTGELILGDLNAATDLQLLQEHNVKTIITAAAGLQHLDIPPQQTHIVFPLLDLKNENIQTYFDLSYQTIELNLKRGSVLVHCGAGISRSATLVIAYYMKKYDPAFSNALKYVKQIRPSVCPNLGFQLQLKKYQEKLLLDNKNANKLKKNRQQQDELAHNNGRDFLQKKPMMLTFNAPNHHNISKESKNSMMSITNGKNFSGYTPLIGKKIMHFQGQKKVIIDDGSLFIEGKSAKCQLKSESLYDPEKYRHKGSNGTHKNGYSDLKL